MDEYSNEDFLEPVPDVLFSEPQAEEAGQALGEEGTEGIERENISDGETSAVDFSELTLFLDTKFSVFESHLQFYDVVFSLVFVLLIAKLLWWVFWDFLFRGV